jgi:hypothetical protein
MFKILNVLTHSTAVRFNSQVGNEIECRYKLKGYGIPIHLLPITETGAIKLKYFHEWLRVRRILDEASEFEYAADDYALRRVVVCPGLHDVVFRQGTPSMKNPGNVIFRETMITHLQEHHNEHTYQEGHQQQPDEIDSFCTWLIETTEYTKGGRFLEWDKQLNVWVKMVDRQKIKNKVAIAYRDATKRFLNHRQRLMQTITSERNRGANDGRSHGGSYAFMEGERNKEGCCNPSKQLSVDTMKGVPLRSDSNYNETSCWF